MSVRRQLKARLIKERLGCARCGFSAYPQLLQVHHKVPVVMGGTDENSNLELLCLTCHRVRHIERDGLDTATLVKVAIRKKKDRGEYTGGQAPWGYFKNPLTGKLEKEPREQEIIRAAVMMRRQGLTLKAIAEELHNRNMRSRNGKRVPASTVWKMLTANMEDYFGLCDSRCA